MLAGAVRLGWSVSATSRRTKQKRKKNKLDPTTLASRKSATHLPAEGQTGPGRCVPMDWNPEQPPVSERLDKDLPSTGCEKSCMSPTLKTPAQNTAGKQRTQLVGIPKVQASHRKSQRPFGPLGHLPFTLFPTFLLFHLTRIMMILSSLLRRCDCHQNALHRS